MPVVKGGLRVVVVVASALLLLATYSTAPSDLLGVSDAITKGEPVVRFVVALIAIVVFALVAAGPERVRRVMEALRRPQEGGVHHHHYEAPVTINWGGPPPQEPSPSPTSPTRLVEGSPDDYKRVRAWEFVEEPHGQPPTIFGYTFRYVEFEGPAVLAAMTPGSAAFVRSTFGIGEGGVESILWPFGSSASKIGPILLQACRFEQCVFKTIGFTGPPAFLDEMRRAAAAGQPQS